MAKARAHPELNRGPDGLQPYALPLSYGEGSTQLLRGLGIWHHLGEANIAPLKDALVIKQGNGSRKLAVFAERNGQARASRQLRLIALQAQLALHKLADARETLDDLERGLGRHPKGELCAAIGGALIQAHVRDHAAALGGNPVGTNAEIVIGNKDSIKLWRNCHLRSLPVSR